MLNSDGEIDSEDIPAKQDAEIAPPPQVLVGLGYILKWKLWNLDSNFEN